MIDDDATDWKVWEVKFEFANQLPSQLIAINAEEADQKGIEDMASLELAMPGLAQAVKTFFTVYKVSSLYLLLLSE